MPTHDDLGKRMKEFYEQIPKTRLMRRCPVALRVDGKSFHTFTRGFKKPFDDVLMKSMQETMKYLCENIQGCVVGYTQSDEITLILVDYKTHESQAFFDYEVQKMCSIVASMATMAFNKAFYHNMSHEVYGWKSSFVPQDQEYLTNMRKYHDALKAARDKGAMFDCRCFNIPKEEVTNLVYWRQLDATRNSIQMVGQANFSHKELQNKSCNDIQDMLMLQKNINWNDFPVECKRGTACIKQQKVKEIDGKEFVRSEWVIDKNMPILKGEDRSYIDKFVFVGE